jgi:hypothetical protein
MKLFIPLSVLVLLGLVAPNLHADPVLTINAAAGLGTLTETTLGGVDTWTFVDNSDTLLGLGLAEKLCPGNREREAGSSPSAVFRVRMTTRKATAKANA